MNNKQLAALAMLALVAAPARAEWSLAVPAGWTDLSPGKTVPKKVPEALVHLTQSGVYHTYAMDLAGGADIFVSTRSGPGIGQQR